MSAVQLTGPLIESFAGIFISPRYDNKAPTPEFHRVAWEMYASDTPQCMVIAPREHAKSTALTTDYVLAEALFRSSEYIIVISSTEESASEQLGNIAEELHENGLIHTEFGKPIFESDTKTDIVVRMPDGHRFRILCRGAEQKIRGRLWKGKRPDLIVGDDMEDDEQVENPDRRRKFRRWFFRAAKQALGKGGRARVHGTVLHEDSLLSRLRKNPQWKHLFYKAHAAFDDFTDILWPEHWSEARLKARQAEFIGDMDSAGYSQEFLNDPQDSDEAYLRREDFLHMSDSDHMESKLVCAAADFAISVSDKANRTSLTVGGKDTTNRLHFLDQRVGRWDSHSIIEEMFSVHARWNPDVFWVEKGQIWASLWPTVRYLMQKREIFINFEPVASITDKAARGRSLQRRMRAGGCRFDKQASWYAGFEQELLKFTGYNKSTLDDQFDSAALLSKGFDTLAEVEREDLLTPEEVEFEQGYFEARRAPEVSGRSAVTGY